MKAYYNSNEILVSISKKELIELSEHCFDAYLKWQRRREAAKTEFEKEKCKELAYKAVKQSTDIDNIINSLPF